jgi:hypothetical protein
MLLGFLLLSGMSGIRWWVDFLDNRFLPYRPTVRFRIRHLKPSEADITSYNYLHGGALLEKPPIAQLLKNFPAFYGRFIIVFTRAVH